jgi:hypothetical protein
MIAAMTLKFLDPFGTGKLVLFQVTYDVVCWFVPFATVEYSSTFVILALARI